MILLTDTPQKVHWVGKAQVPVYSFQDVTLASRISDSVYEESAQWRKCGTEGATISSTLEATKRHIIPISCNSARETRADKNRSIRFAQRNSVSGNGHVLCCVLAIIYINKQINKQIGWLISLSFSKCRYCQLSFKLQGMYVRHSKCETSNISSTCLGVLKVNWMLDALSGLDIICQVNHCPTHENYQECAPQWKPHIFILPYQCAYDVLSEIKRASVVYPNDYRGSRTAVSATQESFQCPFSDDVAPYLHTCQPRISFVGPPVPDTPAMTPAAAPDSELRGRFKTRKLN